MDEPGAHRSGTLRFEWEPSDQTVGLLRVGDGDIRSSKWTDSIRSIYGARRHSDDSGRWASWEASRGGMEAVYRYYMGSDGALLEASTKRPDKRQGCAPQSEGGSVLVDTESFFRG